MKKTDPVRIVYMQLIPASKSSRNRDYTQGLFVNAPNGDRFWINVERKGSEDLLQTEIPGIAKGVWIEIDITEDKEMAYAFYPIPASKIKIKN